MMSEWHVLDLSRYMKPREEQVGGVRAKVAASPYDLPLAVRASLNSKTSRITIEFRYLSTEGTETRDEVEGVVLRVGKESGRLLGVDVSVSVREDSAEDTLTEIKRALDHLLESTPPRRRRPENYRAAAQAIRQYWSSWGKTQFAGAFAS